MTLHPHSNHEKNTQNLSPQTIVLEQSVDSYTAGQELSRRGIRELGRYAFEGYVPLGEEISPYETTRQALTATVIEQESAVDAIIDALDRSALRTPDDHRPIATFAFLGPTGVGKTEMARKLSEDLGKGTGGNLIKIDCSAYPSGSEVTNLLGAPPMYVGRDQEPIFRKSNIEKPGTVVLFDEFEKASPRLHNLLLQIADDGRLQLNNGEVVDFRSTVVIVTSNLGAKEMAERQSTHRMGFGLTNNTASKEEIEVLATSAFKRELSPELINRFNKLVVFHSLSQSALAEILEVKLAKANHYYEMQHGVRVSLSEGTKSHLIALAAKEPHNGARPLVRAIEDNIQSTLGRYIGTGTLREGMHVQVLHSLEQATVDPSRADKLIFAAKHDNSIRKFVSPFFVAGNDGSISLQGSLSQDSGSLYN